MLQKRFSARNFPQFLYNAGVKTRAVLEFAPVRVGLVVLMITYLAIVAQPSTKAFIYFQF